MSVAALFGLMILNSKPEPLITIITIVTSIATITVVTNTILNYGY